MRSNLFHHKISEILLLNLAMGSMAAEPMVDFSIASVRKIGKWTEEIFVITDKPACFTGNRFVLRLITR